MADQKLRAAPSGGASDANRDGVVDSDDLVFVIENMGADVRR